MILPVPVMASIALMNIVFDAIIIIAELLFMLVLIRFLFFNGEFKQYSLFAKIIEIIFLLMVLLIMVALFLTMAQFS